MNRKFFASDLDISRSYGHINLFDTKDPEKESNEMCHCLCKWMVSHGGSKPETKDPYEKKLYDWLCRRKVARKGFYSWVFYPSDVEIAKSYGYPNLFDLKDLEKESNKATHDIMPLDKETWGYHTPPKIKRGY